MIIYWKQMMKTEFYPAAIPLPIIALFIKYPVADFFDSFLSQISGYSRSRVADENGRTGKSVEHLEKSR